MILRDIDVVGAIVLACALRIGWDLPPTLYRLIVSGVRRLRA